ncbi:MAG TPA: sigma-70 family RNA polymerase sigma factor [Candidatus Gastranaerophilaceae bacterium]|nr:sigma-70 family RNA polymerase sigma factor [Candidatus Gastranaerophilaceae bacterium]
MLSFNIISNQNKILPSSKSKNGFHFIKSKSHKNCEDKISFGKSTKAEDKNSFNTDSVSIYIKDISKLSRKSKEEINRLIFQAQGKGNTAENARNQVIENYLPLVVSVAKTITKENNDFLDLVQAGNLKLIDLINAYKPEKGDFTIYAHCQLRYYMLSCLKQNKNIISIPKNDNDKISMIKREIENFYSEKFRQPNENELAQRLKMSKERLSKLLPFATPLLYMDEPVREGSSKTFASTLPENEQEDCFKIFNPEISKNDLEFAINQLTPKQRFALNSFFKENELTKDAENLGLEETGRITDAKEKALRKIRKILGNLKTKNEESKTFENLNPAEISGSFSEKNDYPFEMFPAEQAIKANGKKIKFTTIQYRTLNLLAQNSGKVVSYETFFWEIWRENFDPKAKKLITMIKRINEEISSASKGEFEIISVKNKGYMLATEKTSFKIHDITFFPELSSIKIGDKKTKLTELEYKMMLLFAKNEEKTIPHKEILESVWGEIPKNGVESISIKLFTLRPKLKEISNGKMDIINVPEKGYKLTSSNKT